MSAEERARQAAARRIAFDLAEVAAGVRDVGELDGWLVDADEQDVIDLLGAQAKLASLLAKWVARVGPPVTAGDALRVLRVEAEVVAARHDLADLDEGFPFDA